jgi:hypothetical protein
MSAIISFGEKTIMENFTTSRNDSSSGDENGQPPSTAELSTL